jgi:hypothetical protein
VVVAGCIELYCIIKLIHQITKNERDIDIKFIFFEEASKMKTIHLTEEDEWK